MKQVIPAYGHHAWPMAPHLSNYDRIEWEQILDEGETVARKICNAVWDTNHAYTLMKDGMPIAIWGCTPHQGFAAPWLVGTDDFYAKEHRILVTLGRRFTREWTEMFGQLRNVVLAEHTRAIRWLSAIGYTVHEPLVFIGERNLPFRVFDNNV